MSDDQKIIYKEWAHSPSHLFVPKASYIITAGTLYKKHILNTSEKLSLHQSIIFEEFEKHEWRLEAWAIMINHYHLIARAPENARSLTDMMRAIHSRSARALNVLDHTEGREVWFQHRDTCLTFPASYYARLHYVHNNPVKHGVVPVAENYPWCSMGWFKRLSNSGFRRMVLSFKCDQVQVPDSF